MKKKCKNNNYYSNNISDCYTSWSTGFTISENDFALTKKRT